MDATKKHALAMVRYQLRLKLAAEQDDQILNAPIQNKDRDYVTAHRQEKLRAPLRKYKSIHRQQMRTTRFPFNLRSIFIQIQGSPASATKASAMVGKDGKLLILLIEKIRGQSKTHRRTTSLVRELKRQFPKLYGNYSDRTLKVRYFEAIRGRVAVR